MKLAVSHCRALTWMHSQKKGARQPQRSFLPSIQDHHAWQLWGTVWREEQTQPGQSFVLQTKDDALIHPPVGASPPLAEGPSGLVSPYRGSWIFLPTMTRVFCHTQPPHPPLPVLGMVARQFSGWSPGSLTTCTVGVLYCLARRSIGCSGESPPNVVTL